MNEQADQISEGFKRFFLNVLGLPINLFALYAWAEVIEQVGTTDSFGIAMFSVTASLALVCAPAYNIIAACIMLMQVSWVHRYGGNTGDKDAAS